MHRLIPKKYYFIDKFDIENIKNLSKDTCIIYRNYKKPINIKDVKQIRDFCKKNSIKVFLSNSFKTALRLNLDGAYIPSFNKDLRHLNYTLKKKFIIIGSAHNIKEIKEKERQKVEAIFISSVFKKNKNFLGIYKFKILKNNTKAKVIALGGVSKSNLNVLRLTKCFGFSGISYFKKRPLKKGAFIIKILFLN